MALTFDGLNAGGLWSGNMDDITISGVTDDVRIKFTVSDSSGQLASFTERYAAIDGKVRLSRLGEIAKAYFSDPSVEATSQTWGVRPVIAGEVFNLEGSSLGSFSQAYYYSEFPINISTPANFKKFLSRYSTRTILPDQSEFLAWIDHNQKMILGIAYSDDVPVYGQTASQPHYKEVSFTAGNSGNIRIEQVSLTRILALLSSAGIQVSEDQILFYDAYLYDNGVLIDKIRYQIDRHTPIQRRDIVYFNPFRVPAVLTLTGQNKRSAEMNATYLTLGSQYVKVDTELVLKHESYTGYIDRQSRDAVYDLAVSEPLYQVTDNQMQRITLLDLDISETEPATEPICLKITFRVSDADRQLSFSRPTLSDNRIFDKTFDKTFD